MVLSNFKRHLNFELVFSWRILCVSMIDNILQPELSKLMNWCFFEFRLCHISQVILHFTVHIYTFQVILRYHNAIHICIMYIYNTILDVFHIQMNVISCDIPVNCRRYQFGSEWFMTMTTFFFKTVYIYFYRLSFSLNISFRCCMQSIFNIVDETRATLHVDMAR